MVELKVKTRTELGKKANALTGGDMPAVFYGHQDASTPIAVNRRDFKKVLKSAGESTIITLSGIGDSKDALIYDVQFDTLTGEPRHADFYVIEKGKKLEVKVPLEFVGVAGAVKDLGGTLVKVLHELEISALPQNLPHVIEVDISALATFDAKIHIKDLKLPAGVEAVGNPDDVVVLAAEVKEEVEEEPQPIDLSAIEVEKKGKEVKEGEEGAAAEAPTKEQKK